MHNKEHWEHVYTSKATDAVSWFQAHATLSLDLIESTGMGRDAALIDVGGGASTLMDDLLDRGYTNLSTLDLSGAALAASQARLGKKAASVRWLEADITTADLPVHAYDIWHDRAVFHFLTDPVQRQAYVNAVLRAVKPRGHVIVATFAEDGPTQCSGLPVMRYSATQLHAAFGSPFELIRHEEETHATPFGTQQRFVYCHFRKI
ncbi:MAG: class I SAM-dependent methyltransferase [Burkholderiales bacterium]|nr:class I SAM-dependent methyltransferase [Burkholderiales bacterium]